MRKCVLSILLFLGVSLCADDYIDDIYYNKSDAQRDAAAPQPRYKNGAKEIIFIEDSIPQQNTDTVQPVEPNKQASVKSVVR